MSESPTKDFCHVLELVWRRGTYFAQTQEVRRITDLDATIDPGSGPVAVSDTAMSIDFRERTMGQDEQDTKVTISIADGFALDIARGYAHQQITARILRYEFDSAIGYSSQTAPTYLMEFGRVVHARLNPNGKDDLVEFTIRNCKNELGVKSGRILTPQCDFVFGDLKTCGVDLSPLVTDGTVTSVSGVDLTITEVTPGEIVDKPAFYWRGGSVWIDGLEIRIKDWDNASGFQLSQLPPVDWSGLTPFACELIPGCRHTVSDCREYGNEDRFGGLGIGIPDRNPLFERGGVG